MFWRRAVGNALCDAAKIGSCPFVEIARLSLHIVGKFDEFRTQGFQSCGIRAFVAIGRRWPRRQDQFLIGPDRFQSGGPLRRNFGNRGRSGMASIGTGGVSAGATGLTRTSGTY